VGYVDLRTCSVEQLVRLLEGKLGPVRSSEDIGMLLHGANAEERLRGLSAAVLQREPHHLERMLELLRTDTDARVRARAAMALDELRDPRAKQGLLAAMEDPDWEVRSLAGWGLVHLGETVREDVLQLASTSKNPQAVEMARLVLEKL
jgi:HEAT repeat protein